MASQRHFSPGIYKEAGIPVLDIYGPSTQSYIDRICTTWITQHAHDTPEQLNVELGIYRRRIAEVDERSCDGAAHRQHLADRALFLVIKEMLEHKKAPPKKIPLTTKSSRESTAKPSGEAAPKPSGKAAPKPPADTKSPEFTNQGTVAEAAAQRDARERLREGLRQRIANDPRVKNIEELQRKRELKQGQLDLLLQNADKPGGGPYLTDEEIQKSVTELLKLSHEIAEQRDEVERDLNVIDAVWPHGADRTMAVMVRAVEVVQQRRLQTIAQKYSQGSDFTPDEMEKDVGTILGGERQRQLLGAGEQGPSEVMVVIGRILDVRREQIRRQLEALVRRIEQDSASVKDQEIKRALEETFRTSRQSQLLGREDNAFQAQLSRVLQEAEKRNASK